MIFGIILGGVAAVLLVIAVKRGQTGEEIQSEGESVGEPIKQLEYKNDFESHVEAFRMAIEAAEGYGVPGAIPTIYNNPGDLKPPDGSAHFWLGQTGVGKGGHAIFDTLVNGRNALRKQIRLWATNKSDVAGPATTFQDLAKRYAEDSGPWLNNVTGYLGISPTMTIGEFFNG
jgi:hypothetical protein